MVSSRRSVLLASGLLACAPGCARLRGDETATIREIECRLFNSRTEADRFHVALEATDGLGTWRSYDVPADDRETVTIEPDPEREWVACHGFVNDQPARQKFRGLEGDGTVCLTLAFYNAGFTGDGDAGMMQAMEFDC